MVVENLLHELSQVGAGVWLVRRGHFVLFKGGCLRGT